MLPINKCYRLHELLEHVRYFCSLGLHLEKTNKMITYDDLSTTPVLGMCTCHVIKK